jgi:hypothetical protein
VRNVTACMSRYWVSDEPGGFEVPDLKYLWELGSGQGRPKQPVYRKSQSSQKTAVPNSQIPKIFTFFFEYIKEYNNFKLFINSYKNIGLLRAYLGGFCYLYSIYKRYLTKILYNQGTPPPSLLSTLHTRRCVVTHPPLFRSVFIAVNISL